MGKTHIIQYDLLQLRFAVQIKDDIYTKYQKPATNTENYSINSTLLDQSKK